MMALTSLSVLLFFIGLPEMLKTVTLILLMDNKPCCTATEAGLP